MVERLEIEGCRFAVRPKRDEVVLAAGGHPIEDDVLDLRERFDRSLFRRGHRVLRCLDLRAELLGLRDEGSLVFLRRLRDLLAVHILRGTKLFE